ncbi:hypothetical protein Tco_0929681, partial [Tanacetum coccineum]
MLYVHQCIKGFKFVLPSFVNSYCRRRSKQDIINTVGTMGLKGLETSWNNSRLIKKSWGLDGLKVIIKELRKFQAFYEGKISYEGTDEVLEGTAPISNNARCDQSTAEKDQSTAEKDQRGTLVCFVLGDAEGLAKFYGMCDFSSRCSNDHIRFLWK